MKSPVFSLCATPHRACPLLLGSIALVLSSLVAVAQNGTGAITGTVRDTDQAVMANADVEITNSDTNIIRRGTTSDAGVFYVGALPPGPYTVVVEVPGFKRWSGKLVLQVGDTIPVDPVLEVGAISITVEVSGTAPLTSTEAIGLADVKDYQRIRQLPLNGRDITSLFDLTPGVEGEGNARVNGLKVGSMEITSDGVSFVDRFGGGINRVGPGLDTVQEFRIETSGSNARFSRPATVTLATQSGTNQFHGSLFETHRNNAGGLVARRRENRSNDLPKLIRNEFGFSAGGPVLLPRPLAYDGHNRLFWFGAYEGLRLRQRRLSDVTITPTDAMWNGDLSNLVDANGNKRTIYDPLTTDAEGQRQPFPGNIIPADRISHFAKLLRTLTAPPTNDNNPNLATNFEKFYPDNLDSNKLTLKTDAHLTNRDSLSVRWTRGTSRDVIEGGQYGTPINASAGFGTGLSATTVHNISINHTHNFGPTLLNEFLVGVQRSDHIQGTLADSTNWADPLGLPNPFGATGWPTFYTDTFGWDVDNRHNQALTGGIIENNTTWNKGKHVVQFGGRLRREWNNVRELQQAQGNHEFNGPWTSLYSADDEAAMSFTGSGFADLLLGLPEKLKNQYNRGYFYFRQTEAGLYFNDQWKVTPRLKLDFGLRWDKWTPYHEKFNRLVVPDIQSVFDRFEVVTPGDHRIETLPNIPSSVLDSWSLRGLTYTTARQAGMPNSLFASPNNNFGPRVGATFRITDRLVIRGSYGEYFWTMPLSQILQSTRNNPPLNLVFQNNLDAKNADLTYPLVTKPAPEDFVGRATVDTQGIVTISPDAWLATIWDARNWRDGHAKSWHATLEYELPFKTAVRLSYIGELGRDLEQQFELNTREAEYNYVARTAQEPPTNRDLLRRNPNWDFIGLNRTGFSNSHLAQIDVERRFANGLGFQWFYTYTRSLTTTDAPGFDDGNTNINSGTSGARVPEKWQIWGEPNLSYAQRLRLIYFNSTNVPPHRIRYNATYELPFGSGKKFAGGAGRTLNSMVGGWNMALIGDWRSGLWGSVDSSRYVFGDPNLRPEQRLEMDIFGRRQRLWFRGDFDPTSATNVTGGNLTALVPVDQSQRLVHRLGPNFDNRMQQTLADGTIRDTPIDELFNPSPRAHYLGPRAWNVDIALYKNFRLKERALMRFSAEFFNVFNHPNDPGPGQAGFDSVTGLQDLGRQWNDPRTIQFSLRTEF
jgi:hypothetical protein